MSRDQLPAAPTRCIGGGGAQVNAPAQGTRLEAHGEDSDRGGARQAVLQQAQAVAEGSGRSRDDVIGEALRRQLAGQALVDVLRSVQARSGLSVGEALRLAYAERDADRAERRASASGVSE